MSLAGWESLIWNLNIVATGLLLGKLLVEGLQRSYALLFGYFLVDLAQALIERVLMRNSVEYFYIYLGGQAIKLTLAVLVVRELYHRPLQAHPALAKFSRRIVGYVLVSLAGVAIAGLYLGPAVPPRRSPALHYFLSFERTMDSVLALFLILISIFILWFPLKVRRNAALYIAGFTVYFITHAAALLAANTWPRLTPGINVAALSCSLACVTAFIALLQREGESQQVVTGHRWNPEAMDRLTGQLNALNARLMRIV